MPVTEAVFCEEIGVRAGAYQPPYWKENEWLRITVFPQRVYPLVWGKELGVGKDEDRAGAVDILYSREGLVRILIVMHEI